MNQNTINPRYLRLEVISGNSGTATLKVAHSHDASFSKSESRRRTWLEVIQGALACALIAAILTVVVINAFLFPDCNRVNRDCFLVEKLWGEQ